jgi:hypothetical protein
MYWGDMHGHTANATGKGSLVDYHGFVPAAITDTLGQLTCNCQVPFLQV